MKWLAPVALVLLVGCVPKLTGAPCHTDTNCPVNQYCDGTNCQGGPPPPTRVLQVLVTTPAEILPLGSTVQATATAVLQSDAGQDVTSLASTIWSSSNNLVLQVSNADAGMAGVVLAVATGEANVIATVGSLSGSAHLVVTDAQLVSLVVTVDRPVVAPLSDVTCTATGFFTDGTHADFSSVAGWTSSQPAVVSVSTSPGSVGALVALATGTAQLTASYQQFTGSTSLTVTDATLLALAISPLLPYVTPGTNAALQATGLFSDGTAQPVTSNVQWTVDDPSLAFFLSSVPGEVEGFSPGPTQVEAQAGVVLAQAPLLVSAAPLAALEVAPALPDPLGVLGTKAFTTWGTFADEGVLGLTTQASWTSTPSQILAVSPSAGVASALDAGLATVQAGFGGLTASAQQAVDGAPPSALLVWPPAASVTVGLPSFLSAERVLADGAVDDATTAAGWASSCPGDIQVSNGARGGALAARSPKTCTAAAELNGLSSTASVVATARHVERLEIAPEQVSLGVGGLVALTATAVFNDGSLLDVTSLTAWSAGDVNVLVAGDGLEAGHVLAADAGVSQLTATFGGATATAPVTVAAEAPALELWPPLVQLHSGTERPLLATAVWPTGDALDVTAWTVFSSSNSSVASAANAGGRRGQLAGLSPGMANVSAVFGSASAITSVAVDASTADSLAVTGPSALPAGEPGSVQALAHFRDGSLVDVTRQASWTSSATVVLRLRGTGPQRGSAVALSEGSANAVARFAAISGSTPVATTAGGAQSLSIQGLASAVPAGVQLQLFATANFPSGVQQDVTSRTVWTSTLPQVASVSNGASGGMLVALLPGSTEVTAAFDGTETSVSVNVSTAALTELSILPAGPSGSVGVEVPLQAQGLYSDGSHFDLTAQARWASANPALLAVSNGPATRGEAMALAPGNVTVSASVIRPDASTATGSATFVAAPALPVGVDVIPASVVLSLSATPSVALKASALLSDGTTRDVSALATWNVQPPGIAQVTASGELTAIEVGNTSVSATVGTLTGSAAVDVTP
ncbi:MAG: hypothetical protein ACLQDQ_09625 [Myxococcaceae bacterium]